MFLFRYLHPFLCFYGASFYAICVDFFYDAAVYFTAELLLNIYAIRASNVSLSHFLLMIISTFFKKDGCNFHFL